MMRRHVTHGLALCVSVLSSIGATTQTSPPGEAAEGAVVRRLSTDGLKVSRYADPKGFADGVLTVIGFLIHYSENGNPAQNLSIACASVSEIGVEAHLSDPEALSMRGVWLRSRDGGLRGTVIYQGIKDACDAEKAHNQNYLEQERRRIDEADADAARREVLAEGGEYKEILKRREAESAKRAANWRDGILAALLSAQEPDPFSSIRGDYDLSGSDSRQWKTSFRLPDADKCGLLKSSSPAANSALVWTLACMFSDLREVSGEGYERIVKSVQGVLSLPYQPDERATGVNQVFFADPAKPGWRLYVTKVSGSSVGIAVVAVRTGTGTSPTFPSPSPFSAAPAALPTELTIGEEIEKIRKAGGYTPLPPIQSVGVPSRNGVGVFEVKNNTPYTLTVLFSGPVERRAEVAPSGAISINLSPGSYKVVGLVNAPNVSPSYGEHIFDAGSAGITFYIK